MFLLATIALVTGVASQGFQLPQQCSHSLHRGTTCSESEPSIKYYMDVETLTCLAYKHKGCGGNANSFETKEACHRACIPMDFLNCPANSAPVSRPDNTSHCGNSPLDRPCPPGSVCRNGFAVGICCDEKISSKVNNNYKPDCGPGKKAFLKEQFGFQLIHLGKTCDHEFCPKDSQCQQGDFFAYCCH